mmetsp:Transcript_33839/g.105996  ORF Transcript_33839/g.105996 Transcript_33839/m.105996 type:complete len:216 (-) Transcript_33839:318-965(-)
MRRIQQRLRKKLGRLERHRLAELDAASVEQHAEADLSWEAEPEPAPTSEGEVRDVPIVVIDKAASGSALAISIPDLSLPAAVVDTAEEKVVPICSYQEDIQLREDASLEVMDVFVLLPSRVRGQTASKPTEQEEGSDGQAQPHHLEPEVVACHQEEASSGRGTPRSWVTDDGTEKMSVASTMTWPLQRGAPIPTANTFVHFLAERKQAHRRSHSV